MTLVGSRTNTGRWDSELDPTVCDRYNNMDLTIYLRVYLARTDPAGGAAEGTAREWGTDANGVSGTGRGASRRIVRWTDGAWERWTRRYQQEVQRYWNCRFWLVAQHDFDEMDFEDRSIRYRPNVCCLFRLSVEDNEDNAHVSISVLRLHPSEPSFRSDSGTYDHRDLEWRGRRHNGSGRYWQLPHLHEVGHLLGLQHAAASAPACVSSGSTGAVECYCATDEDCGNIMGYGHRPRASNASPWQRAMEEHGGGAARFWDPRLVRHYPRTMDEVDYGVNITQRPRRG